MGVLDQKLRILVVDSDPGSKDLLEERLLEAQGWQTEVRCAIDVDSALRELRSGLFDVVFSQYILKGTDGLKLLDQIRQLHPRVAVIIMAARGSERIAVEAMKRGAIDFMTHDDLPLVDLNQALRRAVEMQMLQTENLELRQVNRMKDEFISSVSHELRTPLAVILGYAKTLGDGDLGPVSPVQAKALGSIRTRGELLLKMVNRLLAFKEAAYNTQEVLLRSVDLVPFLSSYLDAKWSGKALGDVRIVREFQEGPVWALVDAEQIKDVFGSMLSNAVRFSPRQGKVHVRLSLHGDAEIWVRIQDEGRGVPPELLPRLFDGFVHTDSELTREISGLGIGLALAKQIVELHGGRIWLESKGLGRGTVATVALPVSEPDKAPMTVERPKRMEKKRVLVVDDNPDITELVRIFLAGFSENLLLTTARRGTEALDLVRERRFDLVVLDLMLPDIKGLELLERVKHESKAKDFPILILSGHREAAAEAVERGAQDKLLKPFTKGEFIGKILALLGMERRDSSR